MGRYEEIHGGCLKAQPALETELAGRERLYSLARPESVRLARFTNESSRRSLLLSSVLSVHAALLVWIAADTVAPAAPAKAATLAVFDVAPLAPAVPRASSIPKPAPLPTTPPPVAPPVIAPPPPPIGPPLAAAVETGSGACDLTDSVQTALRDDSEARAALLALPPRARSVANAVMLWDGRWAAEDDPPATRAITRVRRVVGMVVAGASDECRQATQAGPRLITVAGPPDMVLALGSGRWRWADLASDERIASADEGRMNERPAVSRASAEVTR